MAQLGSVSLVGLVNPAAQADLTTHVASTSLDTKSSSAILTIPTTHADHLSHHVPARSVPYVGLATHRVSFARKGKKARKGTRTPARSLLDTRLSQLAQVDLMPTQSHGRLHASVTPTDDSTMTWARRVTGAPVGTTNFHLHRDVLVPSYDDTVLPRAFTKDQGMRTVSFSEEEVIRLATPFQHTLIGRFSAKPPPMEVIEQIYLAPGNFQAQVSIGARDHRSVCIRFTLEEDYRKAWSRPTWRIGDVVMHTSRWTPRMTGTSRGRSQATVPLWIGFPGLPAHLFTPKALQSLATAVGTFIRLDPGVAVFNRPGYARVCVEVDLLEPLHRIILIQNGNENFSQPVIYERLPQFCTRCTILGHTLQTCRSATHPAGHVSFRSPLPPLSYDEYIADLAKGVGDRGPRAPPQTSIRHRPDVETQMEPPPQTDTKVVIPTTKVSSTAPKSSSTSQKGKKKKKTKRTSESLTTTQVTLHPLQTSNSFDVLVGLTGTEISAPPMGLDSQPIAASHLHCSPLLSAHDPQSSRLPTPHSPITHPPLYRPISPALPSALSTTPSTIIHPPLCRPTSPVPSRASSSALSTPPSPTTHPPLCRPTSPAPSPALSSALSTPPSPTTHPPLCRPISLAPPFALSIPRISPPSPITQPIALHTHQSLSSHISDPSFLVVGDLDIPARVEPLSESLLVSLPLPPSASHFPALDHSSDIQSSDTTVVTLTTDGVTIGIPPTSAPLRESEARQSSTTLDHMETPGIQDCLKNCQIISIPSSHTEDTDSPSMLVQEERDSETSYDSLEEDYDPTPGYKTEGSVSRPPRRSPYSTRSRSRSTTH